MITKEFFGTTCNGKDIYSFHLKNDNEVQVNIINLGCAITNILIKNKDNSIVDVVLGYDDIADYENQSCYFGVLVGRHANRIEDAKFTINDVEYQLEKNDGKNHLHGGLHGFDKKVFKYIICDTNAIEFTYLSEDMEEGYPGNLLVTVKYTLTDHDELIIEYKATSDKDTVVNLTNHSYFNLNGHHSGNILTHDLKINSDAITENDSQCLPNGTILPVKNTPFDFNDYHTIGSSINEDHEQLKYGMGYDHNFIIKEDENDLKYAATLVGDQTNIKMDVFTTKPGVQLYTANCLEDTNGKDGTIYHKRDAVCLETQYYPNSLKHANFPSAILKKGKDYKHTTVYKFSY